MIIQVLHCPNCQGTDIVRHGTTRQGKQRYRCWACRQGRGRTFFLDYAYAGQSVVEYTWLYGPRVGSTRSDACGESVRPGGICGCLTSVKFPTMGSFIGENQAVPWAVSLKQELHRDHF